MQSSRITFAPFDLLSRRPATTKLGIDEWIEIAAIEHALYICSLMKISGVFYPAIVEHIIPDLTTKADSLGITHDGP